MKRKNLFISGFIFIIISILIIILWPSILSILNVKYISRLELTKILVSLLGPLLTVIVLINTVNIQEEQKRDKDYNNISNDFYKLLDIFSSLQINDRKIINEVYRIFKPASMQSGSPEFKLHQGYCSNQVMTLEADTIKAFNNHNLLENIGPYFNIVYLILKKMNRDLENKLINNEQYIDVMDIFKAKINSIELFVLYIFAVFTVDGIGIGFESIGSGFFLGNEILNNYFPTKLYVNKTDEEKIYEEKLNQLNVSFEIGSENTLKRINIRFRNSNSNNKSLYKIEFNNN